MKRIEHYKNLSLKDIEGEVWLPIEGYEEKYLVSNMGRIKSLCYARTRKAKILKQGIAARVYLRVDLCVKTNHQLVHRLVGKAFIPNPENKPQINHKWGNTKDNRVTELEWATHGEQQIHAQKILGFKPYLGGLIAGAELMRVPVNKIDPNTNKVIKTYASKKEAYTELGLDKDSIYRVLNGKQETCGGFKWGRA